MVDLPPDCEVRGDFEGEHLHGRIMASCLDSHGSFILMEFDRSFMGVAVG